MKFNPDNKIKRSQLKLVLLFFQEPGEGILKNILNYLKNNTFTHIEYFCKHQLSVTFKYSGSISDFRATFLNLKADELIAVGYPPKEVISHDLLLSLKMSGTTVKLIPIEIDFLSGLLKINNSQDIPHIRIFPNKINPVHKCMKDCLAKAIALPGIVLTGLLFPFLYILIKATSPGPVFYKQKRLGKDARPFMLFKFRTMYLNAEENGPRLSGNDDSRITKVGKILRYWHLDELPQFWNILKGDMALIGPRPERPFFARFLAQKIPYYKIIYQQKPGLTSLGMIKYGYASSIEEMSDRLYYDIVYLNRPTILMDIKILFNTIHYLALKTFFSPMEKRKEKREEEIKSLTSSHDPIIRWLMFKNKINS